MMLQRSSTSDKNLFLVFLYFSCLALSLPPTIVAPPERDEVTSEVEALTATPPDSGPLPTLDERHYWMKRNDVTSEVETLTTVPPVLGHKPTLEDEQHYWMKRSVIKGQPEIQQAMDNMLDQERIIKRNLHFPDSEGQGYPALLTYKTTHLLSEAEHMLNRVKNLRERRWVETFIHRLKILATVVEKSVKSLNTHEELNSTVKENLEYVRVQTEVPENIRLSESPDKPEPAVLATSQQADKLTSKYPVTLPEPSQVLPSSENPGDRQVVTRPGLVPDKKSVDDDDDELVRELEELPKMAASNHLQRNTTPAANSPAEVSASPSPADVASPVPLKREDIMAANHVAIENEKRRIEINLAKEVEELERLGGTREETMHALGIDEHRNNGLIPYFTQIPTVANQFSQVPPAAGNEVNQRVQDVNSDEAMISRVDEAMIWRPAVMTYPPKQSYINDSLQGMHINLPPMNQQVITRQLQNGFHPRNLPYGPIQLHQEGIKNTIQRLQRQHENYLLKNHLLAYPQTGNMLVPGPIKPSQFLPSGNRNFMGPSLGMYRPIPRSRPIYTPYPYFQNIHSENATLKGTQGVATPLATKPFPNSNMNADLSEEMKRQLRDGKVILVSDSVVRSNFEPSPEKDKGGKDEHLMPNVADAIVAKNETQAQT